MNRRAIVGAALLTIGAIGALALAACGGGSKGDLAEDRCPGRSDPVAPAQVLVLGDSNLFESDVQVDAALRAAGLEPTQRGVPAYGLKDIEYWLTELPALLEPDPAVAVVALGTNDTMERADVDAFAARLDTMMTALGDRPVVWLTHVDPRPGQVQDGAASVNAAIRDAPTRWPNLTVLDRTPVLTADPSLVRDDRLHFTPAGMDAFAAAIRDSVGQVVPPVEPDGRRTIACGG